MVHKMKFFLVTLVVLNVVLLTQQASVSLQLLSRDERSISNRTQKKKCEDNLPCGWAFFSDSHRSIETFMQKTCECPKPLQCLRYQDYAEVGAHVYRCREASDGIASI